MVCVHYEIVSRCLCTQAIAERNFDYIRFVARLLIDNIMGWGGEFLHGYVVI